MVKNLPATQETWARSLGQADPLDEGVATHSSVLDWRTPMDRGAWQAAVQGGAVLDMAEWLSSSGSSAGGSVVKNPFVMHEFGPWVGKIP